MWKWCCKKKGKAFNDGINVAMIGKRHSKKQMYKGSKVSSNVDVVVRKVPT